MKIKNLIMTIVLSSSLVGCSVSRDTNTDNTYDEVIDSTANYESLFEKDSVTKVEVTIDEDDWEEILESPLDKEYYSADIAVNDVSVENVGFRAKGNSSLNNIVETDSDRYSFKIKVDKYEDDQTLLGLDKFVLNNMYSDPSYMREYLHYEALDLIGEITPLNTFAEVYVNDEYYGLYLMVESIEDSFIDRNFDTTDGNLYNQDIGSTLQVDESGEYPNSDQKMGEDESKEDLDNLAKTLDNMQLGEKGDIESVLDVDSALRYFATDLVFGNYDSYLSNMTHNYYMYSEDGYFTILPWDFNMSIGGFGGLSTLATSVDEPTYNTNIENLPLANKLLAVPEYKQRYEEYVVELLEYVENIEDRVLELQNIIEPYVQDDPTKFYTMEEFYASIESADLDEDMVTSAIEQGAKMGGGMTLPQDDGENMQGMTPSQGNIEDMRGMTPPQGDIEDMQGMTPPQGDIEDMQGMTPTEDDIENMQGMNKRGNGNPNGETDFSIIGYMRHRLESIKQELGL